MQNVSPNSKSDSSGDNDLNDSKNHSRCSSPLCGNINVERGPSLSSLQSHFMAEISESDDDDDISEVESFILEQDNDDDCGLDHASKFLLAKAAAESGVDAETQCRLEALFEASGQFFDGPHFESLTGPPFPGDGLSESMYRNCDGLYWDKYHPSPRGSSLAEACSHGDIITVRKLLEEGRNVNEVTEDGESLLSIAAASGYFELAQLLLAMKANVDDRGLKDMTPLMEACNSGIVDIVKLLIEHGADVNAQTSQERKIKGKVKDNTIKIPQEHNTIPSIVCPEGNTPLMFACAAGHLDVVKVLLDAGAQVEDHNENGHTPLMEAASAGFVAVARLLVQRGASINTHSNEFKESALTLACYKGHLEMVRFLLDAGADREHKTDEMHTALMEASMDGHVEVARLLLDSGAQVNMPADSFESPLTLAACGGHVELAMLLLERGANIEEVNDEGYTPLMEAAREGHEEMIALLLSQGADINSQTEETQETALTLAACGGFLEVVELLIKAGADIELGASTALMEAAQEGHIEVVRCLINSGASTNSATATGDTALTYACENGHTDVAEALLNAYAKLEHEAEGGRTPLMKAARGGHIGTVQFLLSKGADINRQTANNDHTPLSLACAGGHLNMVELLLNHGADPTHKLKDNSTMLIEASKGGHTAVVQMLLDYPNGVLTSPTPPSEIAEMSSSSLESNDAPRVPPHGLQVYHQENEATSQNNSYLANIQTVPRIQDLLRESVPPQQSPSKQKSIQRRNTFTKNNEAPSSSFCESGGPHYHQHHHHHRLKSNASAQACPIAIQAETCKMSGGGGNIEGLDETELRPSDRLEQCINSMIKKAEMLRPSPEEQIFQKRQILEELQRVERELQERAQAQIIMNQQQQQGLHGLGTLITSNPSITSISGSTTNTFTTIPGNHPTQQFLISNGPMLDLESLPSFTDISSVTNQLGLHLPPSTNPALIHSPLTFQNRFKLVQDPQQHHQQTITSTTTTLVTEHCKPRSGKPVKQAKINLPKHAPPQMPFQALPAQLQSEIQTDSQPMGHLTDSIEKFNLRNIVLSDQQQQQLQLQQQLLQQHTQQQYVLSEITQNLTLKGAKYCENSIADLVQAMGGIKINPDGTQMPAVPMYDPVAVGQALLQQQQQHLVQHQQLAQQMQQEAKRQQPLQQQYQAQVHQTCLPQQHFEKNVKLIKGKTNKAQQQAHVQLPQPLTTIHSSPTQPGVKPPSCGDACTFLGNLPVDGAGLLTLGGMGSPAFPVTIAVAPMSISTPVTISTTCAASFAHNVSLDEGLMVAAPARTLNETLGEIVSGPTTQLAGTHMNLVQQSGHCSEACLNASHSSTGKTRSLSMSALPNVSSTAPPMSFHTIPPAAASCMPLQMPTSTESPPHLPHVHTTALPSTPAPPIYPPLDLNSQTDSNHDTALTLACQGGHCELITLLLSRGANIEHRDKKGFLPLMLASSAGHAKVCKILLNHSADIEAQADRTKDTALSLACSGGRYEVVEVLLTQGANKEHRNVSDYTPLSLAASGGYVNIIKLLLTHGAEINSRTGSKLGISPLMLAAMNGHTQAVKLLLDMGSDINAQIETNRNTALTLACFQGRHEVVSLLLDRRANVEHRAKTGLTPLMEAASGGYVDVGRVLIEKGADVNAPPVPSSRDTALTIAADKGHFRFVQLLLENRANVDVKNKKGNSPLWLAAHGGHLEVVQLLFDHNAEINSMDNRKVSCLMAAFRKGHIKVVKWMVKQVRQFPADHEMARFMTTLNDKEMIKKCSQCIDLIRLAKDRQALEANKNANILLEELEMERDREEQRKLAAAKRREKKRQKRAKQAEKKTVRKVDDRRKNETDKRVPKQSCQHSDNSDNEDEAEGGDEVEEEKYEPTEAISQAPSTSSTPSKSKQSGVIVPNPETKAGEASSPFRGEPKYIPEVTPQTEKRLEREKSKAHDKIKRNTTPKVALPESSSEVESRVNVTETTPVASVSSTRSKKRNQKLNVIVTSCSTTPVVNVESPLCSVPVDGRSVTQKHFKQKDVPLNGVTGNASYDGMCFPFTPSRLTLPKKMASERFIDEMDLPSSDPSMTLGRKSPSTSGSHLQKSPNTVSPKKWAKRDEEWKEVVRSKLLNRPKKVSVPSNAISRVIGRGGMNINAIREASGAYIEVEKQKNQGDRTVNIRGSAEATRVAQQLIEALIHESDKDLLDIISWYGLPRPSASFSESSKASVVQQLLPSVAQTTTSQSKSITRQQATSKSLANVVSVTKTTTIPPPSLPANATPPFTNQVRSVLSNNHNIRPGIPICSASTHPFLNNGQNAWTGVVVSGKMTSNMPRPSIPICTCSSPLGTTTISTRVVVTTAIEKTSPPRQLFSQEDLVSESSQPGVTTSSKTTVSYTMAIIAQGKSPKTVSAGVTSVVTKVTATSDTKVSTISPIVIERAGSAPPSSSAVQTQMTLGHSTCTGPSPVQPFSSNSSPKSNSSITSEQSTNTIQTRVQVTQAPVSKPFLSSSAVSVSQTTSTAANPPSTSPVNTPPVTSVQSAVPQEYTPFSNVFAKVTGGVWGQKETSKPNFASVAASGVTSVASQIQNSNPAQSSLALSLPQSMESDLMVDVTKAPGYRGNLLISPSSSSSASSNSQTGLSTHNVTFGPIGSGPRSAPCTPPLGPIGTPAPTRMMTPPLSPSSSAQSHQSRSLPDTQSVPLNELPKSRNILSHPPLSSQISEAMFQQAMGLSSHPSRLPLYPMATSLSSPGGTNTTFSQNAPLSSVGSLLVEGGSSSNIQVVQSNLNPNAPDFSSRASLVMSQHGAAHLHHLQRLPSSSAGFQQENSPHLVPNVRPLLPSASINPNFNLHSLSASQNQTQVNRFPFHMPSHQQQTDFNPNAASGTMAMSQEAAESMPLLSMVPGYHHPSNVGSSNMSQYAGMQAMMGMRPNQRSSNTTSSVGTSKDEGSPMSSMSPSASSPQGSNMSSPTGMSMQEDRKLPRPIGMERAQKKNPMFGGVSDVGGIWSYSSSGRSELPSGAGEWMQNQMPQMQQEEGMIQHNYNASRFSDMVPMDNHPMEQPYPAVGGGSGYPFINGLPSHVMSSHIYQNSSAMGSSSQLDGQAEMWGMQQQGPTSLSSSSGSGDGLPHNVEHKMQSWQNWSPHQT